MTSRPKLILLYGAAGVGKTTIADRYISEHPFTLAVSGDELVVMIGRWLEREGVARHQVFEFTKAMAEIHLKSGHDVLLPYLPTNAVHLQAFEELARRLGMDFLEVELSAGREDAVRRLLRRGTWGEKGTDPITEADIPVIEALYDTMQSVLSTRSNVHKVPSVDGRADETYESFKKTVAEN